MSTIKQVLQQASQSREPQSPKIYRRGRVNNSAAYYRGAKPDPEAGRLGKTASEFLNTIAKPLGQIVGKKEKEFSEAERNAGIASFTRATPEQRAKMRKAIKEGLINESESPYFREGVSIAYTKNLLGKYNQELFQRYEDWDKKNNEDSGSFDEFLDNFDSEYAPYFETIHEDILVQHFIPGQMGIHRQLQQRHTEHLNQNYRQKAEYQKSGELFGIFKSYNDALYKKLVASDTPLGESLRKQEKDDTESGDTIRHMYKAFEDKKITADERKYFESTEYGRNFLQEHDAMFGVQKAEKLKDKPVGPAEVTEETKEKGVIVPESGSNYDLNIKEFYDLSPAVSTEQMKTGSKANEASNYNDVLKKRLPKHYKKMMKSTKNQKEFVEYMEEVNGYPANNIPKGVNIKFDPVHFAHWLRDNKK